METVAAPPATCSKCAAPLNANGGCIACLLRAGLDKANELTDSGALCGDYEIERRDDGSLCELGRGAMGVTYRAFDKVLHRRVALKIIEPPAEASDFQPVRERFLREARAAAALRHPNVAGVFHFSASPEINRCYYAMELVDGETLEARVRREGPLPLQLALELAIQVTHALVAAAQRGLVHRDLKPGNIMLARVDDPARLEVKVIDFGLAKAAAAAGAEMELTHGGFVGTPAFASPEQFTGDTVDARSDIYALGVTLWFALTGRLPFPGSTIEEIRRGQAGRALPVEQLRARAVPRRVVDLLRWCLAIDPDRRPGSAGELMQALKSCRSPRPHQVLRRTLAISATMAVLCLVAAVAFWRGRTEQPAAHSVQPDKSIAVLPFENLSHDQENAFFADGVQEEILSSLAKVADLKVISRTSANNYAAGQPRNSREIGQQLGVAHLLEGNVQRIGNRLRINAQLIDTRTDSHLWAEIYDRDIADLFAIQSEIAQTIADQLQAKISPAEKAAVALPPTSDLVANDLYLKAIAVENEISGSKSAFVAINLLEQAVARDPRFLRAYCALTRMQLFLYEAEDHTPARLQAANATMRRAAQLQPDAGEVHLVRARYLMRGLRDYDRARAELELARRTLPNDATVYVETAMMDRRQARWGEALRNFERAIELDPRNAEYLKEIASTCSIIRRYGEADGYGCRALALSPHDNWSRLFVASQPFLERADVLPWRMELEAILAQDPSAAPDLSEDLWSCAILERDLAAAERALAAMPPEARRGIFGYVVPREWRVGYTAWVFNRPEAGRAALTAARAILEKQLGEQPDNGLNWALLGRVNAALGEKQDAIAAGQHACELLPLSKEPLWGLNPRKQLAAIYACVGEKDLALQQLGSYADQPNFVNYGELKLDPDWDPLRGDPRFEKMIADLAPEL